MKLFLKQLFAVTTFDGDTWPLEAIYSPGFVENKKYPWIRDSSDGVTIYSNENGRYPLPIEVKSRVSPNTYAIERSRMREANEEPSNEASGDTALPKQLPWNVIDASDKVLRQLVPSNNELLQTLHHAVTYWSGYCFLIIGDNNSLMSHYLITFSRDLCDAYINICRDFYKRHYIRHGSMRKTREANKLYLLLHQL